MVSSIELCINFIINNLHIIFFLFLPKITGQVLPNHDETDEDAKNTVISGFGYIQIEYVQT